MTPEILAALDAAKRDKRPIVLATRLPDGEQQLLPDPAAPAELNAAAETALRDDESGTVKLNGTDWFLHAYNPPLRLIVVGAVHIAQALVPFATQCGFAVTVVDPAPLLRLGRALPQRHRVDRVARRSDGRASPRQPDRRRDADARPQAG